MPLHACTIVARNYLPHARVLASSFLAHNPGSRFTTLVIDDRDRTTSSVEPFEILHLDTLLPNADELHLLAAYYDVMELATAVKPLLLLHLLRQTAHPVVYLDPDIEVFADLGPVEQATTRAPIVLTPHTMVPFPRDGLRPTEAEIMGSGLYNLGFVAIAGEVEDFLRWWWERLQRDAIVAPARQLFTDQRWVDFVPSLFDHVLLKDPGLNVAYWNLHGRDVRHNEGRYEVDGHPLRFFHFSGYSPFRPEVLSKHTGDHPRVRLHDSPAVAELARSYGEQLIAAGLTPAGGPDYGWGGDGGLRVDSAMRRAFQDSVRHSESQGIGAPPPNPFSGDAGESFLNWLRTKAPGRRWPSVNRYLYAVYDLRADLQRVFPEGERGAEQSYLNWASKGALALTGPAQFLVSPGSTAPPDEHALPAVHAVGYFKAELGMGEYGRQLVEALSASGVSVNTTTWTETISRQQHPFGEITAASAPPVNLLVVNADQTPIFAKAAGAAFFEGRYTVGAWAWEVEEFPAEYDEALDIVDEVWAISEHTRAAIARRTTKPVFTVPPPIAAPSVDPSVTRASLGLPDEFLFLFSFDYLSVPKRKNPLGLVRAFTDAFAPNEGPVLVLKSINGAKLPVDQAALRAAVGSRSDIVLLDDYLTPAERTGLTAVVDCYVSLHRSEGLGLTMAEAMALGKPVIATGYSGNMTFMDDANSFLVPYDLVPIGADAAPYPASALWAEPRLAEASALMRRVWSDPRAAADVGLSAAADIARKHSAFARHELVRERLESIARHLPDTHNSGYDHRREISLTALQRGLGRARFLAHVARTPEMRRAAIRRRLGNTVSAGFGQSRRAIAEQEATRREVLALRSRVELVARDVDIVGRSQQDMVQRLPISQEDGARSPAATLEGRMSFLELRFATLEKRLPQDASSESSPAAERLDVRESELPEVTDAGVSSAVPGEA